MPCTVPEKYEYLHAAFPGANLFDAMGELNANGKMAEELFAKRKLLKEAIFVHDPGEAVLYCQVASILVLSEAPPETLKAAASLFLEKHGIVNPNPKINLLL